jgi:hypothetical protein
MGIAYLALARSGEDDSYHPMLRAGRFFQLANQSLDNTTNYQCIIDLQAPMMASAHALVLSRMYQCSVESGGSLANYYNEKLEFVKMKVEKMMSATLATWGHCFL